MASRKNSKLPTETTDFRHNSAKRTNIPPAKIASEGKVPKVGKQKYAYSPHLNPILRFDTEGRADKVQDVVDKACAGKSLLPEEQEILRAVGENWASPWLEWSGKQEEHDKRWRMVDPVALHIHERISANAILSAAKRKDIQRSLFADPELEYQEAVQFYKHDMDWANRLILGDSLQVMSSLARRERLNAKVQMIYIDPPYGINYKSNFQPEVGKRDVKEVENDLTREPEMVSAFRDTWKLGVHSYLSYLRDRLIVAKELLAETGSVFVQISDENLHRVTQLMDEVFGSENFMAVVNWRSMTPLGQKGMARNYDYLLWYSKKADTAFVQPLFVPTQITEEPEYCFVAEPGGGAKKLVGDERLGKSVKPYIFKRSVLTSSGYTPSCTFPFDFQDKTHNPLSGKSWRTTPQGIKRLIEAERIIVLGKNPYFRQYHSDFGHRHLENSWHDTAAGFSDPKTYVVQTHEKIIQRCMLMTTRPGDLILDPTCGGGTSAVVAEQWGRRWITIDTSRVAIALSRKRLIAKMFPHYKVKAGSGDPAEGFEFATIPHIELGRDIAQNEYLDPIVQKYEGVLAEKLQSISAAISKTSLSIKSGLINKLVSKVGAEGISSITEADRRRWLLPGITRQQVEAAFAGTKKITAKQINNFVDSIPPERTLEHWQVPFDADSDCPTFLESAISEYRNAWQEKMVEVNACIAANAKQEILVDKPFVVKGVVRVSGPFTVEGVMPEELMIASDETLDGQFNNNLDFREVGQTVDSEGQNLHAYLSGMVTHIKKDGVCFIGGNNLKFERLESVFASGSASAIHAEGVWEGGGTDRPARVGIGFGPQKGPVTAKQVEELVRGASRNGYDELVVAGFSFDAEAHAIVQEAGHPKLKIHMAHIRPELNSDMAALLKDTPKSQLFTVFGAPSIEIVKAGDEFSVTLEGVDIYDPVRNTVQSTGAAKVAAWFLDSDFDGRCFCVTQAFFPDQNAWERLAKALKDVVDPNAFEAFKGTTSLPFKLGKNRQVAVKVIDPRGNEVMTVHKLED
jgi:adenine-specific DNA-methyltransferase